MRFDNKNDHLRLVFLQDNLWGDFTVGWNPIWSNTLGLRLVRGSVGGLTQIDLGTFPDIALGLLITESWIVHFKIRFNASSTRSAPACQGAFTLEVAPVAIVTWSVNHFLAIEVLAHGGYLLINPGENKYPGFQHISYESVYIACVAQANIIDMIPAIIGAFVWACLVILKTILGHHHFETITTLCSVFIFTSNTLKFVYFDLNCFSRHFLIVGDVAFITFVVFMTNSIAIGVYLQDGVI